MSAWLWAAALALWAALMAALIAEGAAPITGTVAVVGIVLLVANARAIASRRPVPLTSGGTAVTETALGAALLTFTVVGGFASGGAVRTVVLVLAIAVAFPAAVATFLRSAGPGPE